jgi:hypothetical protein
VTAAAGAHQGDGSRLCGDDTTYTLRAIRPVRLYPDLVHQQALPDGPVAVRVHPDPGSHKRVPTGRFRATPVRETRQPGAHHHRRTEPPPVRQFPTFQVVGGAVVVTASAVAFDMTLTGRLSMFFDLCFVLVGLSAALLVRRQGLFAVGVLPPLLLGAVAAVLAGSAPGALTASHLAFVSTWLTGLAHHGGALAATHLVVLAIVGLRAARVGEPLPRPTG